MHRDRKIHGTILSKSSTLTGVTIAIVARWESTAFGPRDDETCEPAVLLFLDQIKREKGVWWMPWQQEAMKDVIPCVKLWGAGNRL